MGTKYKGRTYYATGKTGTRFADGIETAEYATADDSMRIWIGVDGRIALD
jgi:hypothetical protein